MDPCEDLTDDDIRTAIQNATGPKAALFVPDVGPVVLICRFKFSSLKTFLSGILLSMDFSSTEEPMYQLFPCN